jgi:hypothetical protein
MNDRPTVSMQVATSVAHEFATASPWATKMAGPRNGRADVGPISSAARNGAAKDE